MDGKQGGEEGKGGQERGGAVEVEFEPEAIAKVVICTTKRVR